MIINDLERNDLEIVIAKMNEAKKIFTKLAANSVDADFVSEMDVTSVDLEDLANKLRDINNHANVIDFSEYYDRYLKD